MMRCGGGCWGVLKYGYGQWEIPVGVGMFCMYRTAGGNGAVWWIGAYYGIKTECRKNCTLSLFNLQYYKRSLFEQRQILD